MVGVGERLQVVDDAPRLVHGLDHPEDAVPGGPELHAEPDNPLVVTGVVVVGEVERVTHARRANRLLLPAAAAKLCSPARSRLQEGKAETKTVRRGAARLRTI